MSQGTYPYQPSRGSSLLSIFTLVLVLTFLGVEIYRLTADWRRGDQTAQLHPVEPRGALAPEETSNIEIFERCSPSTVHVHTFGERRDPVSFNVFKIPQGSGSGIVWDKNGRIITNFHVVAGARRQDGSVNPELVQVTLFDHSNWNVQRVIYDQEKDLAVLWIGAPAERLRDIAIGESSKLKVGQRVYAIGNPFGLDQSLSTGIISALGREIEADKSSTALHGLIQTDAAINPGNSGGPLLDSAGRLIGVNAAIVSPSGAWAGIGFAIPIDDVNQVVTRLINEKGQEKVQARPVLGVHLAPDQIPQKLGIDGVLILDVVADGPAAKAGLRRTERDADGNIRWGDFILAIDGKKVHTSKDLFAILQADKVGQEVAVTIRRDDMETTVKITLAAGNR